MNILAGKAGADILLVTDKNLSRIGLVDKVLNILSNSKHPIHVLD